MVLTQEQLDGFARDGFLPYLPILEGEELERYRQEYDRQFEIAEKGGQWRNLAAANDATIEQQKQAPIRMLQIMQMCERSILFRKLIHDQRILGPIADLIGPNIMLFHDQALFKPAHHGGEVTWHQDNGYWQCRPANLVSCWLTLDDVDEDNGAMQFVPGSHLHPVWHTRRADKDVLFDIKDRIDTSHTVTVSLPAGACLFHHCQTLHHTNPNTTPRQRRAFAIHCMTPGTSDRSGNVMPVSFARPMLSMRM